MRCRRKNKSMRVILRFTVGLMIGLFVLGLDNAQNVEGSHSYKGRFHKTKSLNCGDMITSHAVLYNDLDCSEYLDGPALTLEEGASLDLNGKKVVGFKDRSSDCIQIEGDGAKLWNGSITQCDDGIQVDSSGNKITNVEISDSASNGILVKSNRNKITDVKVTDSGDRGIRIQGDENLLMTCSVANSGSQGIRIDDNYNNKIDHCIVENSVNHGIQIKGGNGNKIYRNTVRNSCHDGIEINRGNNNSVFFNQVEDNCNPEVCPTPGDYNPSECAGIDVTFPSQNNEIKFNRACGNRGCFGTDCIASEGDFWDENFDSNTGQCDSTNRWKYNNILCINMAPECNAAP